MGKEEKEDRVFKYARPVMIIGLIVGSMLFVWGSMRLVKAWNGEEPLFERQSAKAAKAPAASTRDEDLEALDDRLALARRETRAARRAAAETFGDGASSRQKIANVAGAEPSPTPLPPPVDQAPGGPPCGRLEAPCPAGYACTVAGTCEDDGMVYVPAGSFKMGCSSRDGVPCDPDQVPAHSVTLSAYAIDRTEVTVGEYRACVEAGTCTPPKSTLGTRKCQYGPGVDARLPVTCVSWAQASKFCFWREKRLPTEAQWEKAARGSEGRRNPWGEADASCALANIFLEPSGCGGQLLPVGSFPAAASPYGALDMIGNVLEWTQDVYHKSYYYDSPDKDPTGPIGYLDAERALRGSSFTDVTLRGHAAAVRYHLPEATASPLIGFRCAKTLY